MDFQDKRGQYLDGVVRVPIPGSQFETVVAMTLTAETETESGSPPITDTEVMKGDLPGVSTVQFEEGDVAYFKVRIMCASMELNWAFKTWEGQIAAYRTSSTGVAPVGGGMTSVHEEGEVNYKTFPDDPTIAFNGNALEITVAHTSTTGEPARFRWVAELSGPMVGGAFTS